MRRDVYERVRETKVPTNVYGLEGVVAARKKYTIPDNMLLVFMLFLRETRELRFLEGGGAGVEYHFHERWGAGVEYHFQEFNEPYAPS